MIPVIDKLLVKHFYTSFRILFAGELTQRETFGEGRFWDRFRERSRHSAKIAIDLKTATCQHRNAIAILSASVGSQLHAPAPHRRHLAHPHFTPGDRGWFHITSARVGVDAKPQPTVNYYPRLRNRQLSKTD